MNVLVAVASRHGSTEEIAAAIVAALREAQLTVSLQAVDDVEDPAQYDAVILGSAVYAGQWLPEARRFATEQHAALAARPLWLFSSEPLGPADSQPPSDPTALAAPLAHLPVRDHAVFAGKLSSHDLGLGERLIARVVHAPEGDFRDWAAIHSWAQGIARALQPVSAVSA